MAVSNYPGDGSAPAPHHKTHEVGGSDVVAGGGAGGGIPVAEKGAANGVATLDANTLLPTAQLPPLAITRVYVVASEVLQLALTTEEGDAVIRTDSSKTYFSLNNTPAPKQMTDYQELLVSAVVVSVNGATGAVTLDYGDVGASAVGHLHTGADGTSKLSMAYTHESPDTDLGLTSLHHTLGTGGFQAATGDHGHALLHVQGTDQGLDTGGPNAVTAAQASAAGSNATQALADASTADGKAVAAQGDATQALADASTADGKAVAAQGDATQALADAADEVTLTTNDDNWTTLEDYAIAEGETAYIKAHVTAGGHYLGVDYADDAASYEISACVRREIGGNVELVGSVDVTAKESADAAAFDATLDVDTGTQTARVRVKGLAEYTKLAIIDLDDYVAEFSLATPTDVNTDDGVTTWLFIRLAGNYLLFWVSDSSTTGRMQYVWSNVDVSWPTDVSAPFALTSSGGATFGSGSVTLLKIPPFSSSTGTSLGGGSVDYKPDVKWAGKIWKTSVTVS